MVTCFFSPDQRFFFCLCVGLGQGLSSQLDRGCSVLHEEGTKHPGDTNKIMVSFLAGAHTPLE